MSSGNSDAFSILPVKSGFLVFLALLSSAVLQAKEIPGMSLSLSFKQYSTELYNQVVCHKSYPLMNGGQQEFGDSEWEVQVQEFEVSGKEDALDIRVQLICTSGRVEDASVSVDMEFSDWSSDNYVMVPAALYNGNRYPWRRIRYSPKLMDPRDIGPDKGIILSDVYRLNHQAGPSFVQLRSGAMTTPSVSFWDPQSRKAFIMLTTQESEFGDNGIFITENKTRDKAVFSVVAPVVREQYKYFITDSRFPSDDIPAVFEKGDSISFTLRLYSFEAPELQSMFDTFAELRKDFAGERKYNKVLPLSEAFRVQEAKFNRDNWVDEFGYYSVGMRENFLQDWQIGWTGGMISTWPLLFAGNAETQERVLRNFDWVFEGGISPSGFFWDSGEGGDTWYGGDIRKPHTKNWHLVRKSGDGLYFVMHQFFLMKSKGIQVKPKWEQGARGVADAFVKLWRENGQLGQFIDNISGEIQVGGSTSGGIVPAGLVLASEYFAEPEYARVAEEICAYFYRRYTQNGLAFGGPGDAMQNFDSESGYAIIESYYAVYTSTGNKKWLKAAEDAAKQFSTWVMSYNFNFPENSTQGAFGIEAVGAVFANTQNTHGSPGICTHSGLALLKLYRATGDYFYLDLLSDIVHAIPQCLAHPKRAIEGVKSGWMGERINTTDWLEGIGEIMYGSTWAETSLMLTKIEIPGLYVVPDRSLVVCFDNLEAEIIQDSKGWLTVEVYNPTEMDAEFSLWVESSEELKTALGNNYLLSAETRMLKAGKKTELKFKKR